MLLSVFSTFYELLLGNNYSEPAYTEMIFKSVGLLTLIIAALFALLFYVVLGRLTNVWHNKVHWGITIAILAVVTIIYAFSQAKSVVGYTDAYLYQFSAFNGLYAAFYFFIFSLLFKNFSIHSKRTPF